VQLQPQTLMVQAPNATNPGIVQSPESQQQQMLRLVQPQLQGLQGVQMQGFQVAGLQGSILQNSISTENFSDKFSSSNFGL
jgi:hypothetical protein